MLDLDGVAERGFGNGLIILLHVLIGRGHRRHGVLVLLEILGLLAVGVHARRGEEADVVFISASGAIALTAVGGLGGKGVGAALRLVRFIRIHELDQLLQLSSE